MIGTPRMEHCKCNSLIGFFYAIEDILLTENAISSDCGVSLDVDADALAGVALLGLEGGLIPLAS